MKKQYRLISVLCVLALWTALLSGCGGVSRSSDAPEAPQSVGPVPARDLTYIREKGVLTVGVTNCEPIGFLEDGEWTGFDAELAGLFAESLGVEVSFLEIDWGKKVDFLEGGEIDCIWNGMTRTDKLVRIIDCSTPYLKSAEVIVLPREQFNKYDTREKSYHLLFAVENGSTAQETAETLGLRTVAFANQNEVFEAVVSRKCDAAIADRIYARQVTAEGGPYETLQCGFPFNEERISVGLRKGSALTKPVNEFLSAAAENGVIVSLAERYKLQESLLGE